MSKALEGTPASSLWVETARTTPFPALDGALAADVAVVGGGITGLTAALLLQREGRSVVLLEAEALGSGTTGATSALVTSVPDIRYTKLIDRLGIGDASAFVRASRTALETIHALARRSPVPCDFSRVPAYLFTESADDVELLEKEADAARELGLGAVLTHSTPLPFPVEAAALFPSQCRFHPIDYLQGLARLLVRSGGRVFEQTRVTRWEEKQGWVMLETGAGTVTARKAILATHIPLGFNLIQTEVAPYRSYMLALSVKSEVPDALFWDTAVPYRYFRRHHWDGKELLLLGGEDHKSGHDGDPEERYRRLETFARARFRVTDVVRRWSSQYYEPADGLPYVGTSPLAENVLIATGYSGTGLVLGVMAAQVLTDCLQGRESRVADLLDARRLKPIAAARNVLGREPPARQADGDMGGNDG